MQREKPRSDFHRNRQNRLFGSGRVSEPLPKQRKGFLGVRDRAFELGVFGGLEHFLESRSGGVAGGDQVAAGEQGLRAELFGWGGLVAVADKGPDVEVGVGGKAVHAVQGEVFGEVVEAEEALEGGLLHPRGVGEAHVVFDDGEDLARFLIGESETAENVGPHGDADFDVAVEADAVGRDAKGGRLADVVEQGAPGERRGAAWL